MKRSNGAIQLEEEDVPSYDDQLRTPIDQSHIQEFEDVSLTCTEVGNDFAQCVIGN